MNDFLRALIAGVVLLVVGGSAYLWWQERQAAGEPPAAASAAAVAEPAAQATAPLHHAIEAITPPLPEAALPPLTDTGSEVSDALSDLLGRQGVLSFLDVGDFAHRVVATVDNLARAHAASRLWPVVPAPGRFQVSEHDGATYIADDNAKRYAPFVRFVSAINSEDAVALYVRMYPMLQKAYEELGYPGKYFNDRLVQVIDLLLATPESKAPVRLTLTEVKGTHELPRPWVRYEYADTSLEGARQARRSCCAWGPRMHAN